MRYQSNLNPAGAALFDQTHLNTPFFEPILIIEVHVRYEALFGVFDADVGEAIACTQGEGAQDAAEVLAKGTWPETE